MKNALALAIVVALCLVPSADAGIIPIRISRDTIPAVSPAPVKCGVPFPKNTYHVGDPIKLLDAAGQEQTLQTRVTATWDPAGEQGVRWLLIDFLADSAATYTLHFGQDAALNAAPVATTAEDVITIDTGTLKGTISRRGFDPFSGLTVDGAPIVQPPGGTEDSAFNGFYIEHEKRGIFRADLDNDATITLEEVGPVRACVKATGWYVNSAGERFGRFAIRMHFTKDSSTVRVLHTFIYTGLSKEDVVTDVGLQLEHLPASYPAGYGTWGVEPIDEGRKTSGHNRPETPRIAVVQDSYDREHFEFKTINLDTDEVIAAGEKLGGWFQFTTRPVVLTATIKDAWQQYPFEFEFNDRLARIHLWPKHGRKMDLTWDGYWWWLTDRQKRYLAQNKPHKEDNLDDWLDRLRDSTNATGAAKTHELSLTWYDTRRFDRPDPPPVGYALARDAQKPVYAYPDPVWVATTRALDWCLQAPPDFESYGDEERYAQAFLKFMTDAVKNRHYYGFWDFGGYHQHLASYQPGRRQDDGGFGKWHRARPKSHYGWGTFAWLNYFRGGDRRFRDYARTYTLYSADRAHCHHTDHGRIAGAEYHYDNSEMHWLGGWSRAPGGDVPSSNLQQKDDYVFNYWLTGDRRTLDVLELWGTQMAENGLLTGAWLNNVANIPDGNQNRNAGMVLHRLCMLYQATWDKRYLTAATQIADSFAQIDTVEKLIVVEKAADKKTLWHSSSGWVYDGLWQYWNLTGDKRIEAVLLLYCRRAAEFLNGSTRGDELRTFSALTYGYELTGDEMYLNLGKALCNRLVGAWINEGSFHPIPKGDNVVMMRFVGAMANAPQAWRDAHLPTNVAGDFIDFRYAARQGRTDLKPSQLYLHEKIDGDWSIDIVLDSGGSVVVTRPDGREAVRKQVVRLDGTLVRLDIPRDGMTGTYIVASDGITDDVDRYLHPMFQPYACVIRKPDAMPMVVSLPQAMDKTFPLRGRAFYFHAPAGRTDLAVLLRPSEGEARTYIVEQVDGSWQARTDQLLADATAMYTIALPKTAKAQMYRLRPHTSADRIYQYIESPRGSLVLQNLPPYISASPDEWFDPTAK